MTDPRTTRAFLNLALAAPFCYFLTQILAAPFYPNYDFLRMAASDLGSSASSQPMVFNIGAMLGGLVTVLGAYGFWRGLQAIGTARVLVWLVCSAIVLVGISSLWAGIFPLPDPRHQQNLFALFGLLPLPFLMAFVFWSFKPARVYVLLPVLLFLLVLPFISGLITVDRAAYDGLLQRLLALATFSPIGIGAGILLNQKNWLSNALKPTNPQLP